MKSDKARKVTSREYIMKLIYQIEMNKEDIENIEEKDIRKNILEKFNEFPYWIRVQLDFLR